MKIELAVTANPDNPRTTVAINGELRTDATVTRADRPVAHGFKPETVITINVPSLRAAPAHPDTLTAPIADTLAALIQDFMAASNVDWGPSDTSELVDIVLGNLADAPLLVSIEPEALAAVASFRELEHAATHKAKELRNNSDQANPNERAAARDLSLAITALEDAGIRYTRGLAELRGVRSDVDLERMDARTERERFVEQVTAHIDVGSRADVVDALAGAIAGLSGAQWADDRVMAESILDAWEAGPIAGPESEPGGEAGDDTGGGASS